MYSYDFKKEYENVLYENRNMIIEIDDNSYNLATIVTNKNLLLFNNLNKNHVLNGRGMTMPSEFVLELKIPLNEINYAVEESGTYIKYNNKEIIIYNFNITEYLD